ncbi:MAG: phosphotransferase [Dehalococcoidia bacterium]|nr:phosphotransferase [Dehalococcoidia bacterium]MYD29457.1 phosphotransferase [Dehalococcoidia bacterium]
MTTHSDLQKALEPWGAAEVEAEVSGLRNRVWRIRLRGERCVARQNDRAGEALDWELDLLRALHDEGFSVPLPIATASGERRVGGLVVLSFIEGREPEGKRDAELVGDELRRLHSHLPARPQRPGFRACHELIATDRGGDVDISLLPAEAAALCRSAWRDLPEREPTVIHGDPSPTNIRIDGDRVGLLDWDEARVDSPLLDLGALPNAESAGLPSADFDRARRASVAWEVAVCWQLESDYARRRLRELRDLSGKLSP